MKINLFTLVNGILNRIKDMEGEFNAGWMEADMKDIGKMIGHI